eukprot:s276_g26.t1
MDFDSTLGFPGEGPNSLWTFGLSLPGSLLALWTFILFLQWVGFREGWTPLRFWRARARSWIFVGFVLQVRVVWGVSHGPALDPRNAADVRRAEQRAVFDLPEGRPVLGRTQEYRDKLLGEFDSWLRKDGLTLDDLIGTTNLDIDFLNLQLERYGRSLFLSGRPYGHYAETINGVSGKRPRVRRLLQQAWDLAYAWVRHEPPCHHIAPWQALLSLLATAFYWGWIKEAGILALSWGGLTRIGEALSATRKQLVLPRDIEFTADFVLLQIDEPKTRYRAARHQVAKVDQPQLMAVLDIAFGRMKPHQRLWPFSGQTMRTRFQKLLSANRLDTLPRTVSRGLDLGSLRAGGASWLMLVSDSPDLTRRRGRWITNKVMEIYVQEVSAVQFIPHLPLAVRKQITDGAALFPWMLEHVQLLQRMQIPPTDHYPDLLPSFKELDHAERQSVQFTQCNLCFNHGWLVQAEAPPGAIFTKFREAINRDKKLHAGAKDVALYFVHWLTDLAGAEPTPLGGCEKFVIKFPLHVLNSFLQSFKFIEGITSQTETQAAFRRVMEKYLKYRWSDHVPSLGPTPTGPHSIAAMRLLCMAQANGRNVVEAFSQELPMEDRQRCSQRGDVQDRLRRSIFFLGPSTNRGSQPGSWACISHILWACFPPNAMPDPGEGNGVDLTMKCNLEVVILKTGLRILAEIYRCARELWPEATTLVAASVHVRIDTIKGLSVAEIQGVLAKGELWLVTKHNESEAYVGRASHKKLNKYVSIGQKFQILDLGFLREH